MTAKDVEKMREQQDKDYRAGEGYSAANEDEEYGEGEVELDMVEES